MSIFPHCTTIRLVTLLLGAAAAVLFVKQVEYVLPEPVPGARDYDDHYFHSLASKGQRAHLFRLRPNPIDREMSCLPMAAFARSLDERIKPEARIFVSGVLGTNDLRRTALYCVLRNYLFPREMEISLDGRPVQVGSGYDGVPYKTRGGLRTNGFDIIVEINPDNTVTLFPLTRKGLTK
jgi:hypothetical protein